MIELVHPALLLISVGLLMPLLNHALRSFFIIATPIMAFALLLATPLDTISSHQLMEFELVTFRYDALARVWALIFCIAALLGSLYSLHLRDRSQDAAALVYGGAALGAVLAGDLITLFIYWEITALSSVLLIWASKNKSATLAGSRYLVVQILSGVLLLIGAVWQHQNTGSIAFVHTGEDGNWFMLAAFGIKACFPVAHCWLQDSYPKATITGTVILSAFSTKLAIYALARGFAGMDALIVIGAVMTVFPIFFAVIENDLRKVLAYSLNNQLGFMVVGIGIGSELALNGTAAHAFCHIIYKALLFMSIGAVMYRTGTAKASELGGMVRYMPYTAMACVIGAMSISAFPLFSGFVSKSLIISATAGEHLTVIWLVLTFASAGVLDHSGIKIPFFTFFAHDQTENHLSRIQGSNTPPGMGVAMAVAAFLCIAIGVFPEPLYQLLPYPVDYNAYTGDHVVTQMQLLMFSILAFVVLMRLGLYPPEIPGINLDIDWIYRRLIPETIVQPIGRAYRRIDSELHRRWGHVVSVWHRRSQELNLQGETHSRRMSSGEMVSWVFVTFALVLVVFLSAT